MPMARKFANRSRWPCEEDGARLAQPPGEEGVVGRQGKAARASEPAVVGMSGPVDVV